MAEENSIPLLGGFLLSMHFGACAAMGWDFYDMGYKTGQIVLRVKKGKSPARIPFQSMAGVKLYLNLKAAARQGVKFSGDTVKRANEVFAAHSGYDELN